MTTDQHTSELRVLLGPQAGSRLALSAGEYLLGTSDECTIILTGPRVDERHLTLLLGDDGIRVRPEGGDVRDASGTTLEADAPLALGSPLKMGGIWITVDAPDAPWPDAQALDALGAPPARTEAPARNEAPEPDDIADTDSLGTAAAAQIGNPPARAPSAHTAAPARHRMPVALGVAALASATCIAYGLNALWTAPPPAEPVAVAAAPAEPVRTVATVLRELGLADQLKITQRDSGAPRVTGYLATADERSAAMRALSELQPPPEVEIYAQDVLLTAAADVLVSLRIAPSAALKVQSAGAGQLRLVGAASDMALVDAASNAIMRGVPGVHGIEASSVLLPDALLAELKQRLTKADLAERVVFVSEQPSVVVGGVLSDKEMGRWQQLYNAFRSQFAEALPVRTAFARPAPTLPFEIKTIVGGTAPYIVTASGEHVARGGQIAGLKLASIDDAQVVFDGKQRLQLPR